MGFLPSGMASIYAQITACHETTGVTDQECCGPSVFLRLAETAQHVLLWPLNAALGVFDEEVFYHCGYDVAWGDGVDSDTVGPPFAGEVAGELDDACL